MAHQLSSSLHTSTSKLSARARESTDPRSTTLDELSEEQRSRRFALLQEKLPDVWAAIKENREGESIVIVPSLTLDRSDEQAAAALVNEERFLFLLLLLRQPLLRLIYVTSRPIAPSIVDYYLGLLPGVIPSHAKARLSLLSAYDGGPGPLTAKILERPALVRQIRRLIPNPDLCHLVPYNTTTLERDLALELGIPMYGADPRFFPLGTKTGCRRLFAEAGIPHPLGFEDLHDLAGLAEALTRLRAARPSASQAIVKLNEGVSGDGNATVDLSELPEPGSTAAAGALAQRVRAMAFEAEDVTFDAYLQRLEQGGGIVEERITGGELRSPSVQLRITPVGSGEVELLSTHDQMLGGPSGQKYLGCRFPADPAYAAAITAEAAKIGVLLARKGVMGRFALDFVVVRDGDSGWSPYAIELNLRKGGTTHPFLTLQFLTDGSYDPQQAVFRAPSGQEKHLVATDHLESPLLRGLTHEDLFDIIVRRRLHFDQSRQTGVVFHIVSALSERGLVGLTAVGDSPEQADASYREAEGVLLAEARSALEPATLAAP
jgi:hypothetical protein